MRQPDDLDLELVARSRDAVVGALLNAYEDAGVRGLCGEGRWEAAVGFVRSMDPRLLSDSIAEGPSAANPPTSTDGAAMPQAWKPERYSDASPYLIVDGADRTIDFLVRAFDAERLRHFPAPDGMVMHAEVRIGDSVVMIADGNEGWPPISAHVHLYVADVDATYRRALAAGAEPVQEPVRKDDEDRRGGVKDPGGTTWWIATREE